MNANTNGRLNKTRHTPNLTVAPVTRAIRSALAISATLLALGGSGAAIAQSTCTFTAATTVSCEGVFTNTLPDPSFFTPVADLTLVLGDSTHSVPTSVTPAAGLMGIDANWSGSVGVTSYADITTVGATGIFAYSASTATVTNNGDLTTNVAAAGAKAMDVNAYGSVTVVNTGPVNAYNTGVYDVTAVSAHSSHGSVSIINQAAGTITATAQDGNAIAVEASAYSGIIIRNYGAITASSVNGAAVGALSQSSSSYDYVINSGGIAATSDYSQAVGVLVNSTGTTAAVINSGSISATSGQDEAIGAETYGYLALVSNSGSITATSTGGTATGVLVQGFGQDNSFNASAQVINSGDIHATSADGAAVGVLATGPIGYARVTNTGTIAATGNGKGSAIGIAAYSLFGSYVTNTGTVSAITGSATYGGTATGILVTTDDTGGGYGTASVTNSGSITATSKTTSVSYPGAATGVLVTTYKGGAFVTSSSTGSIAATAQYHNNAIGVAVDSTFAGDAYVNSAGSISATTQVAQATGILAQTHYGTTTIGNSGDINVLTTGQVRTSAYAPAQRDYAQGIIASSNGGSRFVSGTTTVTNSGSITAQGSFLAEGIEASAGDGAVSVTNTATGAITVTGDQFAIGIGTGRNSYYLRFGDFEDDFTKSALINNAGSITVTATGNPDHCGDGFCQDLFAGGIGIGVYLTGGKDVTVNNSGKIAVSVAGPSSFESATGIQAITEFGDATVNNSGSIALSVTGGFNWGIRARSLEGAVAIDNSGSIAMSTVAGYGNNKMWGIYATTGDFNGGTPTGGDISIVNSGDVNVSGGYVSGVFAVSNILNGNAVAITNAGDIAVNGSLQTVGIFAITYGSSNTTAAINNSGSISAISATKAFGITAKLGGSGTTTISNSGDVSAISGYSSVGVSTEFDEYTLADNGHQTINNNGSISASADRKMAIPYSPAVAKADGIDTRTTYGDATVVNTGSITTNAQWDYVGVAGVATSNGIETLNQTYSGRFRGTIGNSTITNGITGSITSVAEFALGAGAAKANGIYATQHITSLTYGGNGGRGYVSSNSGITITNAGSISATALIDAAASGSATANGILAVNNLAGFASVTNDGSVLATATNAGAIVATDLTSGTATATGISVSAPTAAATLDAGGYVGAIATGASGTATGLSVTGTTVTATGLAVSGTVTTSNAGVIDATFNGGGKAYGAMITSAGDLSFTNTGHILASNATSAVGVAFNSPTNVTLTNSGTITANSAAAGSVAVLSTGAANATITNSGTINGAIQTGAGNDSLTNAVGGIWNAVGTSDFGAGDDIVTNAGTINLNNTTISLGSDPAGNQFTNTGLINVLGSNTITMITGTSANSNAFTNNGTINFQNGAANDTLTVNGNFAGNGQINMDVSGLHGTSDLLQIIGNVVAGSVNTVNVRLLDDPTTAFSAIPLVQVIGTSAPGSFVLGQFIQPKGFLGLSESLLNTPHTVSLGLTVAAVTPPPVTPPPVTPPPVTPPPVTPPPVTPPPITISVAVSGLSELGTLAASAAPGVQSLMRSQIGTLEDRMGAVSQTVKGGLSLWTRAFADSGTVDPGHSAGNFGQNGNFGFDQSNSGAELGLDFAISDEFKAGALFAKSKANQSLDGNPADSSKITGDSSGIYGTWISSSGFYLDASYRWMTFNDRLHAPTGYASIHGNANAFNLEAGKTWTLQNGLQIAPQFQYTLTKVDNINAQTGTLAGFQSTGDNASRARLGVMFSKNYTPASGHAVWMPYASLSVVQELDGKSSYSVNNAFFGETNTKGTSVLVETGVNVQFGKLAVFGGLNWQDGGALKSFFGGQLGLRYTF